MDAVASVVRARHPRVAVQGDASGPHPWLLLTNEAPPEAARLMFACHVDTVPPGDLANWQFDPFAADIDNGLLLGRGTSDMKAGVVAAAAAVIGAVEHGIPVALLLTSDEEIGSLGARAARAAVSVAQHQLEGAVQDLRSPSRCGGRPLACRRGRRIDGGGRLGGSAVPDGGDDLAGGGIDNGEFGHSSASLPCDRWCCVFGSLAALSHWMSPLGWCSAIARSTQVVRGHGV